MFYTSSYTKGWMSFVKRSEAAPVCYKMDLFAFICHSDPTKVRIWEIELAKKEVKLLKLTEDDAEQKHSVKRDDVLDETIAKDVSKVAIEKTKKSKQKRKKTRDANASTFPPKKLRDDYHFATSITGKKSLATICSLVPEGSSVPSGIAEPQDDGLVDSVSGINLWTCPPSKRYVISSDDSYHSDSRSEVNFFAKYVVADTYVMTIAVTTIVAVDAFVVQVFKDKVKFGTLETFGDSVSGGEANVNAASSSKLNEPATSSDSFYASQDLDSETLHNIYVPKWKVTNDSVLDDPYVCCDLTDPRQMCLGAEVRIRAEHTLKQKDRLEDKCAKQTSLLSAKYVKISHLRSLLSLKETEAVEAIHLRSQLSIKDVLFEKAATLESMTASKETELTSLTAQIDQPTSDMSNFQLSRDELSSKVAFLELEMDSLADQSFSLEYAFELFKERMEAMQDEQATVMRNRSFEYLQALRQAISCAVNKGIQDGLKARVNHGKARRDLFKDASMVDLMEGPLAEIPGVEDLQPSSKQLMLPLHRPKDNAVLGETSLSFSLQVVHSWVQKVRGEIQEKRLSLTNVMVPFAEPLSSKSLIGEASTSATPVTTEPITTLFIAFMSSGAVPPLSISNDQVLDTKPNDADPPAVTFKKEELSTSLD
nr:hypothetical protein [Tanacetum cinerariifolium]